MEVNPRGKSTNVRHSRCEPTFELRHHIGQVVLQFGVSGKLKAHVIMGDSGECLWRIDAPLVQDAVDAECCGGKSESNGSDKMKIL